MFKTWAELQTANTKQASVMIEASEFIAREERIDPSSKAP